MFLNACTDIPQLTTSEVATRFVQGLNQDNVQVLTDFSELPFYVNSQQWESAKDGDGFVLGKKEQIILGNRKELAAYMHTLTGKLETESVDGQYIPVAEYSRFQEEFRDSSLPWESQDTFLFLRGMGDVEHIVMLGVNRKTNKVGQLYFN
jgi:hypothetical protein